MKLFKIVKDRWSQFWFDPIDPINLSLFRLVFGLNIFAFYLIRIFDFKFLFSNEGILPYQILDDVVPSHFKAPIPIEYLASSTDVAFVLHVLLLVGILALAFGVIGRNLSWLVFLLHLVFIKRNPMAIYGADTVATFWFLYLCLGQSNFYFRLKDFFNRKKASALEKVPWGRSDIFSTISVRFIQIQLCIIYAYSGLEKLKGVTWWRGDAIWNTLSNGQLVALDLSFLHHVPFVIAFATFLTVLWEVYFPVIIWVRSIRAPVLVFGVLLHLSIGLTLGIPFFSLLMISSYCLFMKPEWIHQFRLRFSL